MKKLLGLSSLIVFFSVGCVLWLWNEGINLSVAAKQARPEENKRAEVSIQEVASLTEKGYCYLQLSAVEKAVYRTILQALLQCKSDVLIETDIREEVFDKVFQCVLNDHPEIFYVDGFTIVSYKEDDVITERRFSGNYLYDSQEIIERRARMEAVVQGILKGVPADAEEYDKVRYVYEYLVKHTEYVLDSQDNQNICSVILNGKSVCQGYAKTAQYLLERLGLNVILVSGMVEGGEDHVWNIVQIDGAYYHVDVTWGDASYIAAESTEVYAEKIPQINYEYLCVPDKQLFQTHTICHDVPVPVCESMEANYYVREGAYFEVPDLERAEQLFARICEEQNEYITLKCSDVPVYEELKSCLIDKQRIFRYLPTLEGLVAYTTNEQQLTLSFWLQD